MQEHQQVTIKLIHVFHLNFKWYFIGGSFVGKISPKLNKIKVNVQNHSSNKFSNVSMEHVMSCDVN